MKTYVPLARCVSRSFLGAAAWLMTLAGGTSALAQARDRDDVRTDDARVTRETRPVRDDDRVVRPPAGERIKLKNPDKNFVERVTRFSMEQAAVSRVAAERTSNPRVREFAARMAQDHARLAEELSTLAADKGVVLPAKDTIGEKWLKRDAKDFDLDYLKKMVSDHEDTVKLFTKEARDGEDAELVAFARKHLPALQQHLQHAGDLHKSMK